MLETILIVLTIVLYFVGGAFFSVAYVKGYPHDTRPNLGIMVVFWIFIAVFHVAYQLMNGIGGTANKLTAAFGEGEDSKAAEQRKRTKIPRPVGGLYEDKGPSKS